MVALVPVAIPNALLPPEDDEADEVVLALDELLSLRKMDLDGLRAMLYASMPSAVFGTFGDKMARMLRVGESVRPAEMSGVAVASAPPSRVLPAADSLTVKATMANAE